MNEEQAERLVEALESIAQSLSELSIDEIGLDFARTTGGDGEVSVIVKALMKIAEMGNHRG